MNKDESDLPEKDEFDQKRVNAKSILQSGAQEVFGIDIITKSQGDLN